jgi:hypothetical protein
MISAMFCYLLENAMKYGDNDHYFELKSYLLTPHLRRRRQMMHVQFSITIKLAVIIKFVVIF